MNKKTISVCVALGVLMTAGSAAAKTRITFTTDWPPDQFKVFLAEFQKKHPDISVAMTAASTPEKIWTQIASGSPPDVMYVRGTDAQTYIQSGVLEPLDKYIKASHVNMSDFIPEGMKPYKNKKGTVFALPYDWCPIMTFYNRSYFKAAGIPDLDTKFTTEDMVLYTKKLQVANGNKITRWGISTWMGGWPFEGQWLKAFGGRLFNEDEDKLLITSKEAIAGLAYGQRFWTEKMVGGTFPKSAAMTLTGTWDFKTYIKAKDDWDIGPMPKGPAEYAGSAMGSGYAIAGNSKHKTQAWTFVNELMGPMGMELVWSKGTTPSRRSGLKHFYALYNKLNVKFVEFAMDNSLVGRPILPPGEMTTNTVINPALDQLMQGKISPDQAAQKIKNDTEALWRAKRRKR